MKLRSVGRLGWTLWLGLVVGLFCLPSLLVGQSISNAYLQVNVNPANGNMTILMLGDPDNPQDDLAIADPEDNAIILRIYNLPLAAGDRTGGGRGETGGSWRGGTTSRSRQGLSFPIDLDLRGGGIVGPVFYSLDVVESSLNLIRTRWLVYLPDSTGTLPSIASPSLIVERECVLVGDAVEIRVRVTSQENVSREIGIGIILDPGFNPPANPSTDTPGYFLVSTRSALVTKESVFDKSTGLPVFWLTFLGTQLSDAQAGPVVRGYVLSGEGPVPDKVLFALVPNLQAAIYGYGFDYTPNPYADLGRSVDSAVGIYWNRLSLSARRSVEVVTYYGLNSGPADYRRPMGLRVVQPNPLSLSLGDDPFTPETETIFVSPNPFPVTVFVSNALPTPISNVSVSIGLPEGLSLSPGESATKVVPAIEGRGEQRLSWQVRVNPGTAGIKELVVSAYSPQVGLRQVHVTVLIPFAPVLTLKTGYNLVGFPFKFPDPEPSVALGIPPEELQLAQYNPALNNYLIYRRDPQFNRLEPGLGYWIKMPADRTLVLPQVDLHDPFQPITVPIQRGWNLLSNPFPWTVLLRGLRFYVGSDPIPISLEEAFQRGLVRNLIFTWRNDPRIPPWRGEYVSQRSMEARIEPFQGFWLYSEVNGSLLFEPPLFIGAWQGRQVNASSPSLEPGEWTLQLTAQSSAGRDSTVWLSVSPRALAEWDLLDLPKVPMPPGSLQVGSVVRTGRGETLLSVDARPPQSKVVWSLVITNPAGGEVHLQFDGLAKVPRSVLLLVRDPDTNQQWSLRSVSSLSILTQPNQPKSLEVVALQVGSAPLRVQGLRVTSLRGRGAHIQFGVTAPAQVEVQIRSLTGRVLWKTQQQVDGSRLYRVFWDGRGKGGEGVPPGIYTVVVQAVTDDGRQTQAQIILRWR